MCVHVRLHALKWKRAWCTYLSDLQFHVSCLWSAVSQILPRLYRSLLAIHWNMWFSFLLHHHCALIGPFYTDLSIPYGHLLFSVFEISGLEGVGGAFNFVKSKVAQSLLHYSRKKKSCTWIFHIYHIITYCLEISLVSWATIKNLRSREDRSIGPSKFTL